MKKAIFLILFILAISPQNRAECGIRGGIDFNAFYVSLSPYGQWIRLEGDLIVWHPEGLSYDWSPYEYGKWIWTDYGWYWDSFEPFGWATYHYGRWYYDDFYGWIWIPGYRWAPAWVEWRYNSDYIGWAPLPPYAGFDLRVGIHFTISWHSDYRFWHFVPYRRFTNYNIANYMVRGREIGILLGRTKYRTNYVYRNGRIINYGVDRGFIEKRIHRRIRLTRIAFSNNSRLVTSSERIRGGIVKVYRPNGNEFGKITNNFRIRRGRSHSLLKEKIAVGRKSVIRNREERNNRIFNERRNFNPRRNRGMNFNFYNPSLKRDKVRKDYFREFKKPTERKVIRNRSFPEVNKERPAFGKRRSRVFLRKGKSNFPRAKRGRVKRR